jgi:nucleotide-binding universal stress UspA family protein
MVGYDGSESSVRALDVAAGLAGYGSSLAVVSVGTGKSADLATAQARAQLHRRLVQAGYHETSGEPARQLVKKARELGADLVVIGRRKSNPLLGSVSSKVVRRAGCDVLVVR